MILVSLLCMGSVTLLTGQGCEANRRSRGMQEEIELMLCTLCHQYVIVHR